MLSSSPSLAFQALHPEAACPAWCPGVPSSTLHAADTAPAGAGPPGPSAAATPGVWGPLGIKGKIGSGLLGCDMHTLCGLHQAGAVSLLNLCPWLNAGVNVCPLLSQVRVRVHYSGLNFADILACQGLYQEKHAPPFTPGE